MRNFLRNRTSAPPRETPAEYKHRREELGLTQVQLAEVLGITSTSVARRERGEQLINREAWLALKAIERALLRGDP